MKNVENCKKKIKGKYISMKIDFDWQKNYQKNILLKKIYRLKIVHFKKLSYFNVFLQKKKFERK